MTNEKIEEAEEERSKCAGIRKARELSVCAIFFSPVPGRE